MGAQRMPVDPDTGIPDLVRRLGDDSKRLLSDEVRLAKLETKESLALAGHGALWLTTAFAVGMLALVALTLLVATGIGRVASGHMWVGAIGAGLIDVALGIYLVKRGLERMSS